MKEYGGCLPFELPLKTEDYFSNYNDSSVKLNSGRAGIAFAVMDAHATRVYLPCYICPTVKAFLTVHNIEVIEYNIDQSYIPIIEAKLGDGEVIVWPNYYGCMKKDVVSSIVSKYRGRLIIDNTHAFFQTPTLDEYNVYSCKKFIGVADGAYVIKKNINRMELVQDESAEHYQYLLSAIESSSNTVYSQYLYNSKRFDFLILKMSLLTQRILSSCDYQAIIHRRKQNFLTLHNCLGKYNQVDIDFNAFSPMVYPFLVYKKNLRAVLIANKIYISTWWKHVLTSPQANDFEKNLTQYLLPLPIDQRYTFTDMNEMASIILKYMS